MIYNFILGGTFLFVEFQKGFGVRTPICMGKDLKEVKRALALLLDGCDVFYK